MGAPNRPAETAWSPHAGLSASELEYGAGYQAGVGTVYVASVLCARGTGPPHEPRVALTSLMRIVRSRPFVGEGSKPVPSVELARRLIESVHDGGPDRMLLRSRNGKKHGVAKEPAPGRESDRNESPVDVERPRAGREAPTPRPLRLAPALSRRALTAARLRSSGPRPGFRRPGPAAPLRRLARSAPSGRVQEIAQSRDGRRCHPVLDPGAARSRRRREGARGYRLGGPAGPARCGRRRTAPPPIAERDPAGTGWQRDGRRRPIWPHSRLQR